jgi:hypothetical protein
VLEKKEAPARKVKPIDNYAECINITSEQQYNLLTLEIPVPIQFKLDYDTGIRSVTYERPLQYTYL